MSAANELRATPAHELHTAATKLLDLAARAAYEPVNPRRDAMSALTDAAARLRRLAGHAAHGPWEARPSMPDPDVLTDAAVYQVPGNMLTAGHDLYWPDAKYIAAVNPLVGAAVAELLDTIAADVGRASITYKAAERVADLIGETP